MSLATQTDLADESGPDGDERTASPPPSAPAPEEIAKCFPQLEILECLGRGGMGVVYKARQPRLNRLVALKILAPEREKDPAFASRFEKEAQALAQLSHTNIVTIHDFGQAGGLYYLLMEYVDGVTLRQLLAAGRLAPREALAIVPQICDALQFAHDHGIIHRDIKPENVLMDRRGRVKVADFGLAKIVGGSGGTGDAPPAAAAQGDGGAPSTQRGGNAAAAGFTGERVMGTPNYMAPEQASHPAEVDHRADIYALGVVFYQMLTGELPGQRMLPPSAKVQIDVRLDEVVLRALAEKPEHRYQQVSVLKTCVELIAGQAGVAAGSASGKAAAPTPPAPPIDGRSAKRVGLAFAVGGGVVLLVFVGILWGKSGATARREATQGNPETVAAGSPCAPVPPGVVGWWRAEGDADDVVEGNAGALVDGVEFARGAVGQGFAFNGVEGRLTVPSSPGLNFGAGQDFSIEAWIRPEVSETAFGVMSIVDKRLAPSVARGQGYEFAVVEGRVAGRLSDSLDDVGSGYGPAGPDLRDGQFHHVAMTVDRDSTTGGRLYADGLVVLEFDPTGERGDLSTDEPLRIGNHATPSLNACFRGVIDEVSIYNRVLGSNEVAAICAAGAGGKCVPAPCPAPSGQVSWWRAEGGAADALDRNNGTLRPGVTFAAGKVGQAFAFDETSGGVAVAASSSLDVGLGGGFSIEAWIKPSTVSLERPIVEWNSVTGGNPYPYGVHFTISVPVGYGAGPGCLYANIVDTAGRFHWLTSRGGLIHTNLFQHVALTYDKASGLALLFLNGAVVAKKYLGRFTPQTSYNLYLGCRPGGVAAAYSWAGLLDEVSLYSRALGEEEIKAIYKAGRAGKSGPASAASNEPAGRSKYGRSLPPKCCAASTLGLAFPPRTTKVNPVPPRTESNGQSDALKTTRRLT